MKKGIMKYASVSAVSCFVFVAGTYFAIGQMKQSAVLSAASLSLDDQTATIQSIKKVMPAVVSIIVYDQSTVAAYDAVTGAITQQIKKVQKGEGTGFLITADGLVITNKHVVTSAAEKTGEYRVILNSGKQYYAQLIGKDPLNDVAILKIFDKNLPSVEIGNSDSLQIGTTVIAIGNTLGRYQNSATKGIVSGLGRSIVASDYAGNAESLDNVIQTDANINLGNSGGPLIDLAGKVVGINVAMDEGGGAIGFVIPANDIRQVIKSVKESGRIIRPRLGVRYIMLTPEIAQDNSLKFEYGAWITPAEDGSAAILTDSPASRAGLKAGDIIHEINGIKLKDKTTLLSMIQRYKPGDKIGLKVRRDGKDLTIVVVLDEFK